MQVPDTRYARSGDLRIAYQTWGEGPPLMVIADLISHVEIAWEHELYRRWLEHVGRHMTCAWFDKRGIGMSDRFDEAPTLEQRNQDILAVMDTLGWERAHVVGQSEGAIMGQLFAADFPEHVESLTLVNTVAPARYRDCCAGFLGLAKWRRGSPLSQRSRSEVVNEAAALVRQIERNLHDGAQTRLVTLALHLGMARDKLAAGGPDEVAAARDLVEAAHAGAKEALVELRDLSSGIHPPVLDNGLGAALETLAADSAIPVRMTAHLTERPSPAIETIAYFSAAELLANAVKHSSANMIEIAAVSPPGGPFVLTVSDDGRGGADESDGSGLSGLRHRARTVDGTLTVTSPPGGPTTVSVELPLHP